jgi:hypothetical protein
VALLLFEGKIRSLPRQILGQRAENAPLVVNLSKNGVENLSFRIFALKGTITARFQNPFLQSKIFISDFCGRIFSGI